MLLYWYACISMNTYYFGIYYILSGGTKEENYTRWLEEYMFYRVDIFYMVEDST